MACARTDVSPPAVALVAAFKPLRAFGAKTVSVVRRARARFFIYFFSAHDDDDDDAISVRRTKYIVEFSSYRDAVRVCTTIIRPRRVFFLKKIFVLSFIFIVLYLLSFFFPPVLIYRLTVGKPRFSTERTCREAIAHDIVAADHHTRDTTRPSDEVNRHSRRAGEPR